jgi:hypothetical protein
MANCRASLRWPFRTAAMVVRPSSFATATRWWPSARSKAPLRLNTITGGGIIQVFDVVGHPLGVQTGAAAGDGMLGEIGNRKVNDGLEASLGQELPRDQHGVNAAISSSVAVIKMNHVGPTFPYRNWKFACNGRALTRNSPYARRHERATAWTNSLSPTTSPMMGRICVRAKECISSVILSQQSPSTTTR